MSDPVIDTVRRILEERNIPVMGAASADALNLKAPEGFRPEDVLPGARTVLILARPLPHAVFTAPPRAGIHAFYTASFHTYYQSMNDTVNTLCIALQDAGFHSLPIPSYSPITFHEGEPRGLISLKHAAVEAGIGKMGKNTLLIHPDYGNTTRLGGLITTMDWPEGETPDLSRVCPDGCRKCLDACPVGALSEDGIDKTRCMVNCVTHMMMPPSPVARFLRWTTRRSRFLTGIMDLLTVTFFESYGISCYQCLTACPFFNRTPGKGKNH